MPEQGGANVNREPAVDQVGGQQPPEIVRGEAGSKEAGMLFGEFPAAALEHVHDGGVGDDLVLGAHLALEQERHRRAALPFFRVVAGQQWDGLAASGVTADDGRDDGEQLGGHGDSLN
jgi:hypothetical protein